MGALSARGRSNDFVRPCHLNFSIRMPLGNLAAGLGNNPFATASLIFQRWASSPPLYSSIEHHERIFLTEIWIWPETLGPGLLGTPAEQTLSVFDLLWQGNHEFSGVSST